MRPQPSAGRYFPITLRQFAAATSDWPLSDSEPRKLRNPKAVDLARHLLALLRPGRDVTVYSLPIDVDEKLGAKAITMGLEVLARWKGEPIEEMDGRSRWITVSLHAREQIRVLDEHIKFTRRKFGAGEGLASSRKIRVTSRQSTELAAVTLD